jgi:hypothetical protein
MWEDSKWLTSQSVPDSEIKENLLIGMDGQ